MLLSNSNIKAKKFTWHDTGNLAALENAKRLLPKNKINAHILINQMKLFGFAKTK